MLLESHSSKVSLVSARTASSHVRAKRTWHRTYISGPESPPLSCWLKKEWNNSRGHTNFEFIFRKSRQSKNILTFSTWLQVLLHMALTMAYNSLSSCTGKHLIWWAHLSYFRSLGSLKHLIWCTHLSYFRSLGSLKHLIWCTHLSYFRSLGSLLIYGLTSVQWLSTAPSKAAVPNLSDSRSPF